jgi:hypothetical protein
VAELDQREAGNIDRQIDEDVALGQQRLQGLDVILSGQRLLHEVDVVQLCLVMAAILRGDDADLVGAHVDVAQEQGQDALTDAAESHHDHTAGELHVLLVQDRLPTLGAARGYDASKRALVPPDY